MDVVAAEFVFVENDDLDDELMTDKQNNQRYKNNSILTNLTSELDKSANACRHFVVPCRPHNTDRAHEFKAVAPVAGALGKRTCAKRNPQTGSGNQKQSRIPALNHWVGRAGKKSRVALQATRSRGAQQHEPVSGISLDINRIQ